MQCNAFPYYQPQYHQRYTEINNPKNHHRRHHQLHHPSFPPLLLFPSINIQWVKQNVMGYRVCVHFYFMFYILVMKITRNYMEGLCLCHPGMLENFRDRKSIVHIAVEHLANQIDTFFREGKKWDAKRVVKDLINIVERVLFIHNRV